MNIYLSGELSLGVRGARWALHKNSPPRVYTVGDTRTSVCANFNTPVTKPSGEDHRSLVVGEKSPLHSKPLSERLTPVVASQTRYTGYAL